jgi:hypothetical protein
MAGNLELLEGYLGVTTRGEEDDIPVVVPHAFDCALGGVMALEETRLLRIAE